MRVITDLQKTIDHYKIKAKEARRRAEKFKRLKNEPIQGYAKFLERERISNTEARNYEQLVSWLEELKERREEDRWIPVSERLPEDYTKVLITNEYGIVTCVSWNTWYQNEYKDAKKTYKAIAWRPLPEAYKESEAENETVN